MNKSDLIKEISSQNQFLTKNQVGDIVNLIFDFLVQSLKMNKRIEIRGFGAFSIRNRNVQLEFASSSKKLTLKKRNTVYFRMGKDLFEYLNEKKQQD